MNITAIVVTFIGLLLLVLAIMMFIKSKPAGSDTTVDELPESSQGDLLQESYPTDYSEDATSIGGTTDTNVNGYVQDSTEGLVEDSVAGDFPAEDTLTGDTYAPDPYDIGPQLGETLTAGQNSMDTEIAQAQTQGTEPTQSATVPTPAAAQTHATPEVSKPVINPKRPRGSWADHYGLRFDKELEELPATFPASIFDALDRVNAGEKIKKPGVALDAVTGVYQGQELAIADLNGGTIMAIRRPQGSSVDVHLSTSEEIPLGMEALEGQLDNFYVSSNDPFAAARFIDDRVADSVFALSHVVSDIAINEDWTAILLIPHLDISVWDAIIPHVITLSNAAYTLPPVDSTAVLNLDYADPLAPRNIGGVGIDLSQHGALRAVVDPAEVATDTRPEVTRSSEPVDLPTRAQEHTWGMPADDFSAPLGEISEESALPGLGNEAYVPNSQGPRVVREEASSTLFGSKDAKTPAHHGSHEAPVEVAADSDVDTHGVADSDAIAEPTPVVTRPRIVEDDILDGDIIDADVVSDDQQ